MGNYIAARMRNSETGAPFNDGAPLYSWPHRVLRSLALCALLIMGAAHALVEILGDAAVAEVPDSMLPSVPRNMMRQVARAPWATRGW